MSLAEAHHLRGYDAVQLAVLFRYGSHVEKGSALIFVSADANLNVAASAEGLTVDNPTLHP